MERNVDASNESAIAVRAVEAGLVNPWYAVCVRTNFELRIARGLTNKGYECFVPTFAPELPNDQKSRPQILFPGYLFCRLNISKRLPVLITPGVMSIVGIGSKPVPVGEEEISSIQEAIRRRFKLSPLLEWVAGAPVEIRSGPLRGLSGLLCEVKKRNRLIVNVNLLQRSVMIEVEPSDVQVPADELIERTRWSFDR
jgi:transcription antitermination factor NusG